MEMKPLRADQVKLADVVAERPGGIKAFMVPAKLKNQVRVTEGNQDLLIEPLGKTLVGGTQWAIKLQRPGLAEPLIQSKQEQKAMAQVAKALETPAAPVPAAPAAPAKGMHKGMHKNLTPKK